MQSKAKTVTAYLQELPQSRKEAIKKLRKICLETLIDYQEVMEYGMPCYKKNDKVEVAFASQKNYISFYLSKHDVIIKNKKLLKDLNVGKSCIKFTKPEKIDFDLISKLLSDSITSSDQPC
jgi:uncharacterized protein YdhG (YjbR/CyaY superfamily)